MNIEQERLAWRQDEDKVNEYVDRVVEVIKNNGADQWAYMAVDMVFRSYLHWIHSARAAEIDPTAVRSATINLFSVIAMELATRMNSRDEEGNPVPISEWLTDFMVDLSVALPDDQPSEKTN